MKLLQLDSRPAPEGLAEARRVEEKYYTVALLLQETCDGHMEHALEHLRELLVLTAEDADRRALAWEMNVLLCSKAHQYKVNALDCEAARRELDGRIERCVGAEQIETLLHTMVERYGALVRERSRLQNSNLIRDCLDHIDACYAEPLTLAGEAKRLMVSESYLSARFSRETGKCFVDYLTDVRLAHACQYLERLRRPIQQIAEWCGFSTSNYFARVFRSRMGMTPTQYRAARQGAVIPETKTKREL